MWEKQSETIDFFRGLQEVVHREIRGIAVTFLKDKLSSLVKVNWVNIEETCWCLLHILHSLKRVLEVIVLNKIKKFFLD